MPPAARLLRNDQRHIVALGGGHGLAASLSALRLLTDHLTAVVTVADDGGSSGRLRDDFHVLPPGDLRMALAALCDDSDWGHTWRDVLQHRFAGSGELNGHALGNLMIVSIWELLGDTVRGLDLVGRLLGARGRVLPMLPSLSRSSRRSAAMILRRRTRRSSCTDSTASRRRRAPCPRSGSCRPARGHAPRR